MHSSETSHNRSADEQAQLTALIFKRRAEGLTTSVIAQRLSLPVGTVKKIIEQGRSNMPTPAPKEEKMSSPNDKVTNALAELRGAIRNLKSGMQTHHMQDAQVAIIRIIDTIDTELRLGNKE